MAWEDFEDTTQRSRRPQLTRNVGAASVKTTPAPKDGFLDKVGQVAGQTAGLAASAAKGLAGFVKNSAVDIVSDAIGAGRTFVQAQTTPLIASEYKRMSDQLNSVQDRVIDDYKAGKLSKDDYQSKLKELADARKQLMEESSPHFQGPDAAQRIEEIASTAFNVLSVGSLSLAKAGGKQVLEAGGKETIEQFLKQGSNKIESTLLKSKAFRSLIERNLQSELKTLGSRTVQEAVARQGQKVAFGLLVKRPLFYQANVEDARGILTGIMEGNVPKALKHAAWFGIQMLDGGPLGAASKGYKFLAGKTKELSYGTGSAIDAISRRIGTKAANQLAEEVIRAKSISKEAGKAIEDALRILQHQQQKLFPNDVEGWADSLLALMPGTENLSAQAFIAELVNYRQADELAQSALQKLVKAGKLTAEEAKAYTPVRWTQSARDALAKAIGKEMDIQKQLEILNKYADRYGFSNNSVLMRQLEYAINKNAGGSGDIARIIKEIDAVSPKAVAGKAQGITKSVEKQLAKMGYILAKPVRGRAQEFIEDADSLPRLISESASDAVDLFDPAIAPQPTLAWTKNLLNKTGLSPEASQRAGQVKLTEAVANQLRNTGVDFSYTTKAGETLHGSKAILTKLQQYVEHMKPNKLGRFVTAGAADKAAVTDLRQLTKGEIIEALSSKGNRITPSQARDIQKAIIDGYLEMPLALRGIGPKAVDYLHKFNPAQGAYSRIQSALRYTYNPFFRAQEAFETAALSTAYGGGRFKRLIANNGIWNKTRAELDEVVTKLEDARVFSSSLYGEAAQDQTLGRITANLTRGQKRDLAGLATDIATKHFPDLPPSQAVDVMLRDFPDQMDDALRIIVQYPKDGILASPLARTLNVAFFPVRYNTKVTMMAAQVLAKQPPTIQKAALHGMFQLSSWLKSDEGLAWQGEYADALDVFKWLTPIGSIERTLSLLNGSVDAPADLGLLGGLPVGVFTQMLDSQGIINLNTPYVNPKTGDTIPSYVPQTTRARAATALVDLIGSTFTYPGRILGLPGKNENLRKAVRTFIDNGYDDYLVVDEEDRLTDLQRNMIRVLKGDTSDEAIEAVLNSQSATNFKGFVVPPYQVEELFKVKPRENLPKSKAKGKAKTTARPFPQATP